MESSKPTGSNICTGVSRIVFHLALTMSHIAWWSVRSMSMIMKNLASRLIWIILTITARVHSGVPQRSVLGPLLFTMYYRPLSATIDSHSIIHNSFADDLQSQMSAPSDEIFELHYYMQSWMSDVKCWATANMLSPNDNKTELMLVTSNWFKHPHNLPTSITIGNAHISFKHCEEFEFCIWLSSYNEWTCLQDCSDMLTWTASFGTNA